MTFKAAKCPNCSGDLQVPDDKDYILCMYCGTSIKVRDAIKIAFDSNIPAWQLLAETALKSGNNEEALNYFNKVLEADHTYYQAWEGKAEATANLSTLANFRIQETISLLENAIKYAPEEAKNDVINSAAIIITNISSAYFEQSVSHLNEFYTLNNAWQDHLQRCRKVIDALEVAAAYTPEDRNILEWIIIVCDDNIQGRYYSFNGSTNKMEVSAEYRQYLKILKNKYERILFPPTESPLDNPNSPESIAAEKAKKRNRDIFILLAVIAGIIILILVLSKNM